jgi:hypothetical protein
MNDERTRWTLFHTGHHVVCTESAAPGGLEVRVSYNNLPIAVQHHARAEDAAEWAEQMRSQWAGLGPAGSALEPAAPPIQERRQTRPFSSGLTYALSNSNTLLHTSATSSWFGVECAWRAFC